MTKSPKQKKPTKPRCPYPYWQAPQDLNETPFFKGDLDHFKLWYWLCSKACYKDHGEYQKVWTGSGCADVWTGRGEFAYQFNKLAKEVRNLPNERTVRRRLEDLEEFGSIERTFHGHYWLIGIPLLKREPLSTHPDQEQQASTTENTESVSTPVSTQPDGINTGAQAEMSRQPVHPVEKMSTPSPSEAHEITDEFGNRVHPVPPILFKTGKNTACFSTHAQGFRASKKAQSSEPLASGGARSDSGHSDNGDKMMEEAHVKTEMQKLWDDMGWKKTPKGNGEDRDEEEQKAREELKRQIERLKGKDENPKA